MERESETRFSYQCEQFTFRRGSFRLQCKIGWLALMECKTYVSITKSSFRLDKRKETVAYIWQTARISDAKSVPSP